MGLPKNTWGIMSCRFMATWGQPVVIGIWESRMWTYFNLNSNSLDINVFFDLNTKKYCGKNKNAKSMYYVLGFLIDLRDFKIWRTFLNRCHWLKSVSVIFVQYKVSACGQWILGSEIRLCVLQENMLGAFLGTGSLYSLFSRLFLANHIFWVW